MRSRQLLCSGCSLVGMALLFGLAACSSSKGQLQPDAGQSCKPDGSTSNYVLIDEMETTTHGPIELAQGISSPLSPGYWYNSGASYVGDGGTSSDTSNPPQLSFVFSALPSATTTLDCKASTHAARQSCVLNGLYDTCGVGFEFAQVPLGDAGAPPASDAAAGDGGASVPMVTVPFDISRYKAYVLGDDDHARPGFRVAAGQNFVPRYGHRPARPDLQRRRRAIRRSATTATPRTSSSRPAGNSSRWCWIPAMAAYPRAAVSASPSIRPGATRGPSGSRPRSTASTGRPRGTRLRTMALRS